MLMHRKRAPAAQEETHPEAHVAKGELFALASEIFPPRITPAPLVSPSSSSLAHFFFDHTQVQVGHSSLFARQHGGPGSRKCPVRPRADQAVAGGPEAVEEPLDSDGS